MRRSAIKKNEADSPLELLSLQPRQTFDALACHGDDPVPALRVVRKQIIVVLGDYMEGKSVPDSNTEYTGHTGTLVADLCHDLWGTLDVHFHRDRRIFNH